MDIKTLRDTIVSLLKHIGEIEDWKAFEGNNFSAADVTVEGKDGKPLVFRIAVIEHPSE